MTYPTRVQITPKGTLRARKIILRHIRTGRVVSAPSVHAFARRMKWGRNGGVHFDNVLKGHRLHHRGWGMRSILNRKLILKDVFGNIYKPTVAEVANKVGSVTANKLRRQQASGGLVPISYDFSAVLPPRAYRAHGYVFRAGSRFVGLRQLIEAPDKLGISTSAACGLAHGYVTSVRGVRFVRAHTTQRQATEALTPITP